MADELDVNLVLDLNPGTASSDPQDLAGHLGALHFTADDGTTGRELWRTGSGGFINVSDPIAPGPTSSMVGSRVSIGTELYFVAENEEYGREIWKVTDPGGPAGVPTLPEPAPSGLQLSVGPNPFVDRLDLRFTLPRAGEVHGQLLDVNGRVVSRIDLGRFEAGSHTFSWVLDGRRDELAGGVYFVRLFSGPSVVTRKMVALQ
ncbi:MAG: hypothetical protein R3E12_18935 [Candidatus Eisenbacteria bacterium]